jgi:uncharacterized protein YwgA
MFYKGFIIIKKEIILPKMDCTAFILTTLLNSGGTFESATKLQKLAFLSINENGLEPFTNFKWHHYGPYSSDIQKTVDDLQEGGFVVEKLITRISYSGHKYTVKQLTLTQKGRKRAGEEVCKISDQNRAALFGTIEKYGNKPLTKILDYVYKAYSSEDF